MFWIYLNFTEIFSLEVKFSCSFAEIINLKKFIGNFGEFYSLWQGPDEIY
jgi:hypothetical protein